MMKRLSGLIWILVVVLTSGFSDRDTWVIDQESQLIIHGSTNINNFTCRIECYRGMDTLSYIRNDAACELQFSKNRMRIPVRSFDCGAKQISRDFWATLKSEKYPHLDVRFRSLQDISARPDNLVDGVVDISIAGATTRYQVRYTVTRRDEKTILLRGTHSVNFADFKLAAPEKLKGLIKVREELKVEFNLVLTEV